DSRGRYLCSPECGFPGRRPDTDLRGSDIRHHYPGHNADTAGLYWESLQPAASSGPDSRLSSFRVDGHFHAEHQMAGSRRCTAASDNCHTGREVIRAEWFYSAPGDIGGPDPDSGTGSDCDCEGEVGYEHRTGALFDL